MRGYLAGCRGGGGGVALPARAASTATAAIRRGRPRRPGNETLELGTSISRGPPSGAVDVTETARGCTLPVQPRAQLDPPSTSRRRRSGYDPRPRTDKSCGRIYAAQSSSLRNVDGGAGAPAVSANADRVAVRHGHRPDGHAHAPLRLGATHGPRTSGSDCPDIKFRHRVVTPPAPPSTAARPRPAAPARPAGRASAAHAALCAARCRRVTLLGPTAARRRAPAFRRSAPPRQVAPMRPARKMERRRDVVSSPR